MITKILSSQAEVDNHFDEIKAFCRLAVKDSKNKSLRNNMAYVFYENIPEALMNRIYVKKSFLILTLVYDENNLVSLSGVEPFNSSVALIGRRLFKLKSHRNIDIFYDYMLEPQMNYLKDHNFKVGLFSVNDYNKLIFDFCRKQKRYENFVFIDEPMMINHVTQYVFGIYTDEQYRNKTIMELMENDNSENTS